MKSPYRIEFNTNADRYEILCERRVVHRFASKSTAAHREAMLEMVAEAWHLGTKTPKTDFPVFDRLDKLLSDGAKVVIDARSFHLQGETGQLLASGTSFRDLCVNIVLAGL